MGFKAESRRLAVSAIGQVSGDPARERLVARGLRDESPLEVLVLSPDGRLLVRNSRDDIENADRKERLETWRTWIKDVKDAKDRTQMPARNMMMGGGAGAPGDAGSGDGR